MRNLLVLISGLLLVSGSADAAPAADKIEAAVRKLVPKGWSVTSSERRVVISKDRQVTFYNAVSLPSHEPAYIESLARDGTKGTFRIQLIIAPVLSQRDYTDITSTITQEQSEKPEILAQPLYSESRNGLPTCHGSDYSVYISTSRHPYKLVWPEDQNQEWQRVMAAIKGLFEEYK